MIRVAILCLTLLSSSAALGAQVDFTQTLVGLDRKAMTECKENSSDGKSCLRTGPITLGEVSAASLMVPDRNASLEDQVRRARLAQKVLDGKAVELSADDTKLIKDQVAKMGLLPILVLDVVKVLDPVSLGK